MFLENLQNSQENTCTNVFFLNKVGDSWWKFLRTPFHRTPLDDYFWRGPVALKVNEFSFKYQQKSFKAKTISHILNCVLAFHFHRKILRDQFWSSHFAHIFLRKKLILKSLLILKTDTVHRKQFKLLIKN